MFYRHAGLSGRDDAITFSVSDGISMATTVVQVVVLDGGGDGPQRDPAATLSLEVGEKSSTLIRRSHLAYTVSARHARLGSAHTNTRSSVRLDVIVVRFFFFSVSQDNESPDGQIQIQLVSVPMYGLLSRSQAQQEQQELREYSSFTMEDINALRIRSETARPPLSRVCLQFEENCSRIFQACFFLGLSHCKTPERKEHAEITGLHFLIIVKKTAPQRLLKKEYLNKICNN